MATRKPAYEHRGDDIEINAGRATVTLRVTNTGDRPVQVGSHFHFFEVNRALRFVRELAWGMHLDIPAGTGVRFEPGETKEVTLVAYAGARRLVGLQRPGRRRPRRPRRQPARCIAPTGRARLRRRRADTRVGGGC